jgi:membrane fusion protein, heavy metal efflux system
MTRLNALHALFAAAALGAVSLPAAAAPGAHGPNGEHLDSPTATNPGGLGRLPDGSVNLPMLAQRRLGIRTAIPQETQAAAAVELPARVAMDPNVSGRVQTLVSGRVLPGPRGLPVAGQAVRRGDVLAHVVPQADPIAAANQRAQLAELRSARKLAQQRVARLQSLEGSVPRKEIDAAVAELESFTAREQAVGGSVGAREALTAPVSGVIARAEVVAGQVVESKDILFEIVDPNRVIVEATTADPSLASQLAGASLQGLPGVQLQFTGAARALRDGVLPLTFRARSAGPIQLAIGQPVTLVATLNERVKGYVLPAKAVTRSPANEHVVWVKSGAERYVPQPVQFRPLDAQTVVVTSGLGADNRVVVEGASLIAQIR